MGTLSGGHWENLTAVKKLTQATLIPSYVEEDIKQGNPIGLLPIAQANHTGSSIKWLRQKTDKTAEADVANIGIGGQTSWTEGIDYDEKEAELRIVYLQRKLDKFVPSIYGTFNNYEEVLMAEMLDGMSKKIGDKIVYDDYTYDANGLQFDGLHAIAAENTNDTAINKDMAGALSLMTWRKLFRAMKQGVDFWLIPPIIGEWLDAAYQERGFAAAANQLSMASVVFGVNQMGEPITYFCGKPVIRSDYLQAEDADSGRGTTSGTARTRSSSAATYSLFGIKLGAPTLQERDPGLKLIFGQPDETDVADGKLVFLEYWNKLENWIGKGMRLTSYLSMIPGGSMCVGRIFDITDAAIVI